MAIAALQDVVVKDMIAPALVDDATGTKIELDTMVNGTKASYASIVFMLGVTDIALTALKIEESDSSGSNYGDITASVFGTAGGSLPAADDDGKLWRWNIDLRERKRYLRVVATVGNGTSGANIAAFALLHPNGKTPTTAAQRGADGGELTF